MRSKFNLDNYDLASLGIITFIFILSIIRFNYLPQYVDAYYHLSVANGFIKSGGWVGWSWWDYAPWGRPQLYPPFYHFILVFLQRIGVPSLNSIRITEVVVPFTFFTSFWWVLRKITSSLFAFLATLSLSSFFPFYSSVSANIPASLALTFGLLSWYFFKRKRLVSTTLLIVLCFYTHTGIAGIFFLSFVPVFIIKKYRVFVLKIFFYVLLASSPIIIHQLRYKEYLRFYFLKEIYFIHFSVIIMILGIVSLVSYTMWYLKSLWSQTRKCDNPQGGQSFLKEMFVRIYKILWFGDYGWEFKMSTKKNISILLFLGYVGGSVLVFSRYPYRFFSAQGIVGLTLFGVLILERYFYNLNTWGKKVIFFLLSLYFLFFSQ